MEIIGLMSGTSLDGVDLAHIDVDLSRQNNHSFTLLHQHTFPFPQEILEKIQKFYNCLLCFNCRVSIFSVFSCLCVRFYWRNFKNSKTIIKLF